MDSEERVMETDPATLSWPPCSTPGATAKNKHPVLVIDGMYVP